MKQYKYNVVVGSSRGTRTLHANSEEEALDKIYEKHGVETTIIFIENIGKRRKA